MISSEYSSRAVLFLDEIRSSLTTVERERLKELIAVMSKNGELDKWIEDNFPDEVLKFAQQTPQNRKKNKKWNKSREQFLLLSFYGYMILEQGKYLIETLSCQPEHGAYRNIVASYGQLFLEIHSQETGVDSFFDS